MALETDIKQKALDLGFDAVGITTAEPIEICHVEYFRQWLDNGHAAEMGYLHRNLDKRFAPAQLLPGAKSVICVALNYRPECSRSFQLRDGKQDACPTLRIANFALYEDYHPFIKDRLFQLATFIRRVGGAHADEMKFKACVDSAPLAERALACRAGLGFIGRNRMLIHPELGSQILLGELITTLELVPDEPMEDVSCGDCGRCIRACPTGALAADGSFDARKCISYLTIEAPLRSSPPFEGGVAGGRGGCNPLPPSGYSPLAGGELFKNYIFGCDECILPCPHEMNAPPRRNMDLQHHPEWQRLTPEQIQNMTEAQFQQIFADSGFLRLGLERLKHNC